MISSNLLKILTNHLQCLFIIFSLPINWPIQFWRDLSIISTPSLTSGMSLHCILGKIGIEMPFHYTRVVVMCIHPFMLVLICMAYIKIYIKITGGKSLKGVPNDFFALFQPLLFIVLLISYADFVSISLELFKCIDIGNACLNFNFRNIWYKLFQFNWYLEKNFPKKFFCQEIEHFKL